MSTRTKVEAYKGMFEAENRSIRKQLEDGLRWLENNIRQIRQDIERGLYFEDLNLVRRADEVARLTARLKANEETLSALNDVQGGDES